MPVQLASTSAMTSSSTTSKRSTPSARHSASMAVLRSRRSFSCSANFFAWSNAWRSIADSLSWRMRSISSSSFL